MGWVRRALGLGDKAAAASAPAVQALQSPDAPPAQPQPIEKSPNDPSGVCAELNPLSPPSPSSQQGTVCADDTPVPIEVAIEVDAQPHPKTPSAPVGLKSHEQPFAPTQSPSVHAQPDSPDLYQPKPAEANRSGWLARLKAGLRKTGNNLAHVFMGSSVDETLFEELQDALLLADAGVAASDALIATLRQRVREERVSDPAVVKSMLADALAELLAPLQKPLVIGEHTPTVIMVAGVNGAGKTTSIGKLTKHLADHEQRVLLAAADTFRAAAREQLGVWATRNTVQIISQEGADPAAVSFDAVTAGRARGADVVLVDTAGRLPTQLHLMEELKKIRRVITKADASAPHEVLLVIDGNTGQNALAQVKAFDEALGLTGLIVTKLDGTAKGGVLAAIARERPVPVYFVGVGEAIEDLQTFNAREFAQALLG